MPRTKSVAKRAKQSISRHQRLLPYKTNMKTMIRKITEAAKAGNKDEALKLLPQVHKSIDTAAKKQIIHANTAARKKSFVARLAAAK